MENQTSILVRANPLVRILFSVSLVATGIMLLIWLRQPSSQLATAILILALLAWGLRSLAGSYIEVTDEYVAVKTSYGLHKILWGEVKEIVSNSMVMSFSGHDKRVVVSYQSAGAQLDSLLRFVEQEAARRSIEIRHLSPRAALPLTHRNSKE